MRIQTPIYRIYTSSHRGVATRANGFALIVTLSLMILLTVIAVGLLTLSSISLRSSAQGEAMQIARANARLALMLAVGELQVNLGPDTRITARGDTLAKDSRVAATVGLNTPQAWWVGVSDSDTSRKLGSTGSHSVAWLVSGLSGASPSSQISSAPQNPVTMIGEGSLDLATATGGSPIQAGRVLVSNNAKVTGAYAYFVDDNGMKAQLAASRSAVRNDSTAGPLGGPFGSGVSPGTYSLAILDRMSALASAPPDDLQKLVSTHNLPLVGLPAIDTKSKFFSYTVSSQGVLADVKYGGLKKDLSIAFENSAVFSSVFPADKPDKYILVDPLKRPTELATGYIHWGIFRDYYNLKKQLTIAGATPALAPTMFEKKGLVPDTAGASATDLFSTGQLGPHAMAANTTVNQPKQPYGAFPVSQTKGGNPSSYVFNPISPILSSLQQNAWVSPGDTPGKLKTNVQLFTSHYNPYNVNLMMDGNNSAASVGPRVHNYPQVLFTVSGTTTINRTPGLAAELQAHAGDKVKLEPGRSHVMGFKSNVEAGLEKDGSTYTNNVASIATQSVFKNHAASVTGPVTLTFEFVQTGPVIMHGMDENPGGKEVTQVFFSPFSWDSILAFPGVTGPRPGKRFTVSASQLGLNTRVSLGYQLRTTKESGSGAIRPLVDANVRALWSNPRWDSPLNLPLLAAYSAEGSGEVTQAIPQMQPTTGGQGFSYWGNSHDATGSDRVVLFDVPRRDLVSIGQLQHANAGRFSYEPTYIAGNSYANIRIPLDSWKASITDTFSSTRSLPWAISGNFNLYDASYLINETLFDSYTFTTIPQTNDDFAPGGLQGNAATYSGLLAGTLQLPNPRYLPYKPAGSNFTESKLKELGNADTGSFFHNAGHILVDGSFNVNSTSVDAWEAFLSGTHKLKVHKINDSGTLDGFHAPTRVRFPRAASHLSDGMSTTSIDDSYWTGFRELEQTEVRQIATEVVNQVRQRGPFLNLGDFVNRKLQSTDLGKSGALQAALDLTVNKGLDASYELPAGHATFDKIPVDSTQGSGFPGQLLQGDVLQTLAPYMSVRSDTFTIRAYGEARDSSNRPTARVWCEAVVQRLPDPMPSTSGSGSATQELAKPTSTFGRRFNILSFRWLHPQEV